MKKIPITYFKGDTSPLTVRVVKRTSVICLYNRIGDLLHEVEWTPEVQESLASCYNKIFDCWCMDKLGIHFWESDYNE